MLHDPEFEDKVKEAVAENRARNAMFSGDTRKAVAFVDVHQKIRAEWDAAKPYLLDAIVKRGEVHARVTFDIYLASEDEYDAFVEMDVKEERIVIVGCGSIYLRFSLFGRDELKIQCRAFFGP